MTALVRYEAARLALQQASEVDEVKDIRDKAQAMAAYAKQANDTQLVEWATEIKVRAERKAGEMLAAMKANGSRAGAGNPQLSNDTTIGATLENIGISRDQSSRWQKLAAIPEDKFEQAVAAAKEVAGEVTTAAMLRMRRDTESPKTVAKPRVVVADPELEKLYGAIKTELIDLQGKFADKLEQNVELADTARDLQDKLDMYEAKEPDEQQKLIGQLQKKIVRLEGENERLRVSRNDCQSKNNQLIAEVKRLKRSSK